jgi:NADP-dependent 3-hydroxy acid dehydrogenase YdfG
MNGYLLHLKAVELIVTSDFTSSMKRLSPLTEYLSVVTGATDGIGKEYARQLAWKGFNVFLVSRSQERLNSTAAEISAQFFSLSRLDVVLLVARLCLFM